MHVDTLILGGGLLGLSGAWHLDRAARDRGEAHLADWLLVEKDARLGGLTRTEVRDGYHFDHTGHWLHLRHPEMKAFVAERMGDGMLRVARRSRIWSHGVFTQFPFQQNLHGLPLDVVASCVQDAIDAAIATARGGVAPPANFRQFCLQRFGRGITERFMVPYNTKLWGCPPEEITADWCARFLPKPDLGQIVAGALGIVDDEAGYNATFLYPRQGGIETFARSIARDLPADRVRLSTWPVAIDLAAKTARLSDGCEVTFRRILSSVPLPDLFTVLDGVPDAIRAAVGQLRCTRLRYLNLGIARPAVLGDIQWLYVPEPRYSFYRIGSFSNAVASLAPPGKSSLYVEVGADTAASDGDVKAEVRAFLRGHGWLGADAEVEVEDVRHLRYGYVVFDGAYFGAREAILGWLDANGLASRGRYGGWVYASMEDAMWEGRQFAFAAPP